ncbi:DUF4365 domain-containing protein [Nocardia sp. CA-107356]|uniref:DUF4365 domain-containing protein n=1 Tax=Nocardia sp. CA-107356 TaxID=3239972 RepID=UPI003D8E959F
MQGQWCLDRNQHQGHYGEGFVRALAAAAGLQVWNPQPDCTGVDLQLTIPNEDDDSDFPSIQVQVKSWSTPEERNGFWHYRRLSEKQFNALAGRRNIPRYLVVVIVPDSADRYALADNSRLALAHAAYWVSLEGEQPIQNARTDSYPRILIPQNNLLTVSTLLTLFDPWKG